MAEPKNGRCLRPQITTWEKDTCQPQSLPWAVLRRAVTRWSVCSDGVPSLPDLPARGTPPTPGPLPEWSPREGEPLSTGSFPGINPPSSARKAPGSRAAGCPGGRGNEVSLGSPGVSQMVIKCDEGFDG